MATLKTIHYITPPTQDQLGAAARLIDSTLEHSLKLSRFQRAPVVVVALDATLKVVGVAAIRKVKVRANAAEIGYFAVDATYRRQGIATRLTQMVVSEARRLGIDLLYAWVEHANIASSDNLKKSGFRFFGNYVRRPGKSNVRSWLYLPLSSAVDSNAVMEGITKSLTRVE